MRLDEAHCAGLRRSRGQRTLCRKPSATPTRLTARGTPSGASQTAGHRGERPEGERPPQGCAAHRPSRLVHATRSCAGLAEHVEGVAGCPRRCRWRRWSRNSRLWRRAANRVLLLEGRNQVIKSCLGRLPWGGRRGRCGRRLALHLEPGHHHLRLLLQLRRLLLLWRLRRLGHLAPRLLHHLHHHLHLGLHHHLHLRQLLRAHLSHLLLGQHRRHGPRHHLRHHARLHLGHLRAARHARNLWRLVELVKCVEVGAWQHRCCRLQWSSWLLP
mmetsp:Transcript_106989/g.319979  ORF Transcript_106989/g.319979 Transcript_106989/m.319979 type:complete len:271 (+) Transcript_106989:188-1000(+)